MRNTISTFLVLFGVFVSVIATAGYKCNISKFASCFGSPCNANGTCQCNVISNSQFSAASLSLACNQVQPNGSIIYSLYSPEAVHSLGYMESPCPESTIPVDCMDAKCIVESGGSTALCGCRMGTKIPGAQFTGVLSNQADQPDCQTRAGFWSTGNIPVK